MKIGTRARTTLIQEAKIIQIKIKINTNNIKTIPRINKVKKIILKAPSNGNNKTLEIKSEIKLNQPDSKRYQRTSCQT
jgi:hypothetical protein